MKEKTMKDFMELAGKIMECKTWQELDELECSYKAWDYPRVYREALARMFDERWGEFGE